MKLFQQLLVAPAALGLLAPVAANAADLNVNDVSTYSAGSARVESISQFSDIYPTDWAYTALSSMLERHGCPATSTGGAMTRYEAAALLNSCLSNVVQANPEERRLIDEFSPELAVIKGRLDGVEAGISGFADEFSTTTKLGAQVSFSVGGVAFSGDDDLTGTTTDLSNTYNDTYGAATFNYDYQLSLDTSFSGEDTLLAIIRTGNYAAPFDGSNPSSLSGLEVSNTNAGTFKMDKLYYQSPFSEGFTGTVGPLVGQEDMLAVWPSAYNTDATTTLLDVTLLGGAPAAYHKTIGPGVGLSWEHDSGVAASASYVSKSGAGNTSDPQSGGMFTAGGSGATTLQLGYQKDQWAIAGVYSYLQDSTLIARKTAFLGSKLGASEHTDAYGISAYWTPEDSGLIPSISVGYGWNKHQMTASAASTDITESDSWTVGLEWSDVGAEGNSAGFAIARGTAATETELSGTSLDDDNTIYEAWYKYVVSDNIVISPGIFILEGALGDNTAGNTYDTEQVGGVIRTTFTF